MLVGLTGGIGSGKTAASNAFEKLGVPVVDTDLIAREVLISSPLLLKQLAEEFGSTVLDENGKLIRDNLRELAFKSKESKASLDAIMHPAIRQETLKQIQSFAQEAYCIVVVPLLIETNFKELVDRILIVTAPMARRLEWLKGRSGLNESEAEAIISKQTTDEIRLSHSHEHIANDGSLQDVEDKVLSLHKQYLKIVKADKSSQP